MRSDNVFALIYSDYRRYCCTDGATGTRRLGILLLTQGLWASTVYRLSHATAKIEPAVIRRPLRVMFLFAEKAIEIITGIRLPGECEVGRGLYIGHFGPIILNGKAILGDNCNLSQGVTIGVAQRGAQAGVPRLGDRVFVGPNAVLFGNIEIGSDAAIGAGAVVTQSVGSGEVVAGNPAKHSSLSGSFELIQYDGMETDPKRLDALSKRPSR